MKKLEGVAPISRPGHWRLLGDVLIEIGQRRLLSRDHFLLGFADHDEARRIVDLVEQEIGTLLETVRLNGELVVYRPDAKHQASFRYDLDTVFATTWVLVTYALTLVDGDADLGRSVRSTLRVLDAAGFEDEANMAREIASEISEALAC